MSVLCKDESSCWYRLGKMLGKRAALMTWGAWQPLKKGILPGTVSLRWVTRLGCYLPPPRFTGGSGRQEPRGLGRDLSLLGLRSSCLTARTMSSILVEGTSAGQWTRLCRQTPFFLMGEHVA